MRPLQYDKPATQLIYFTGISFISVMLFSFFALLAVAAIFGINLLKDPNALSYVSQPNVVKALKLVQLFNAISLFIIPPLLFAHLTSVRKASYLGWVVPPSLSSLLLAAAVMIASLPLINFTHHLNMQLSLPEFMSGIELWMKNAEQNAESITKAFLNAPSAPELLFNLFLIALIPAVGEELFFRGVIQKLFVKWSGNAHMAIFITAILFSALHMQFFGFLPRMLMGVLLGYLYLWSGSIIVPMVAHLTNNGLAVILSYMVQHNVVSADAETIGSSGSGEILSVAGSCVIITLLLVILYRNRRPYTAEE